MHVHCSDAERAPVWLEATVIKGVPGKTINDSDTRTLRIRKLCRSSGVFENGRDANKTYFFSTRKSRAPTEMKKKKSGKYSLFVDEAFQRFGNVSKEHYKSFTF